MSACDSCWRVCTKWSAMTQAFSHVLETYHLGIYIPPNNCSNQLLCIRNIIYTHEVIVCYTSLAVVLNISYNQNRIM